MKTLLPFLSLSLLAFSAAAFENKPEPAPVLQNRTADPVRPSTKTQVDRHELLGHIQFLASPELKGREAGSPEQLQTAEYIANEFKRYGLEPWGDEKDGQRTFQQIFELRSANGPGEKNTLKLTTLNADGSPKAERAFEAIKQFAPFPLDPEKKDVSGGVVFAGYGIIAPEIPYDDFSGVDLAGKWVLVLRYEPQEKDANSKFDGTRPTRHSALQQKILNCAMRRAAGVLIVAGPVGREKEKESLTNSKGPFIGDFKLPVFQITREVADALLADSGKTIEGLQKEIDTDLHRRSFAIPNISLSGRAEVKIDARPTANIIARLPGSDPKLSEECVIVGAHCDHIGLGGPSSLAGKEGDGKVHFGADDNASGTSALLEVAQALGALPKDKRPKRSVLLMAFSGEETGLLGSMHYVNNKPRVPLPQTVAMINMDMVGRSVNGSVDAAGIASGKGFRELVQKESADLPIILHMGSAGNGPSDHATFFEKGIPVIFFFTGLHEDYHRPSDTWDKINAATAESIAELARRVSLSIADKTERPQFVKAGSGGVLGLNADAEKVKKGAKGFPVAGVQPNGPAEKAGIRAGDVIIELNGRKIANPMEFSMSMTEYGPGDEVDLKIQRGEEILRMWAKLVSRGELNKK